MIINDYEIWLYYDQKETIFIALDLGGFQFFKITISRKFFVQNHVLFTYIFSFRGIHLFPIDF